MKKLVLLVLLFVFSIPLCTLSYADTNTNLDQFVLSGMKKYQIPGASLAIIKDKKIIYAKAYGYADLQPKRKMTTDTLLQACSISKTTTSLAVLLSFAKNHYSVDIPANDFLTSWKIPENEFTKQRAVTVRMLLDHSAGILNPFAAPFNSKDGFPTVQDLLRGEKPAANPPLAATRVPGTKYEYCNGCYVILQPLLQDVDHKSFIPLMQSLVLTPLKMDHSTFDFSLPFDHPDNIALGYLSNGKKYPEVYKEYGNKDGGLSVGGLWTTPTDLAKFAIAIQESLADEKNTYIPHDIAEMMVQPSSTKTRGLSFFISNKYGDETKDGNYFMHGGFNQGYLALFIAGKTNGDGAIIMINVSPDYHTKGNVLQWDFFVKKVERYITKQELWN